MNKELKTNENAQVNNKLITKELIRKTVSYAMGGVILLLLSNEALAVLDLGAGVEAGITPIVAVVKRYWPHAVGIIGITTIFVAEGDLRTKAVKSATAMAVATGVALGAIEVFLK